MRRLAVAAAAAIAAALLVPTAATPRPPLVVTESESGSELVVERPRRVFLRLDDRWRWTAPRVTGQAVRLVRVRYETDPGFVEWQVRLVARGRAVVTSSGEPNCRSCNRPSRRFELALVVR